MNFDEKNYIRVKSFLIPKLENVPIIPQYSSTTSSQHAKDQSHNSNKINFSLKTPKTKKTLKYLPQKLLFEPLLPKKILEEISLLFFALPLYFLHELF